MPDRCQPVSICQFNNGRLAMDNRARFAALAENFAGEEVPISA